MKKFSFLSFPTSLFPSGRSPIISYGGHSATGALHRNRPLQICLCRRAENFLIGAMMVPVTPVSPTGQVSLSVNAGLYSVLLGDTSITGMATIDESVFQNHNDVHLRIWFSDGQGFEQLTLTADSLRALRIWHDGTGSAASQAPPVRVAETTPTPPRDWVTTTTSAGRSAVCPTRGRWTRQPLRYTHPP